MMYQLYQAQADMLAPMRQFARVSAQLMRMAECGMCTPPMMRHVSAALSMFADAGLSHARPSFEIDTVTVGERSVAVIEEAADRAIEQTRARLELLKEFQGRSKQDLDALKELTKVVAPPAFTPTLEMTRTQVMIAGEAEQAAPLLRALDSSPLFENSEFTSPLSRAGNRESFRIRTMREGVVPRP